MFKSNVRGFVVLVVGLAVVAPSVRPQEAVQSEREAMYYGYLEFASYVKGGSIEPHWMADGSSFWYAEGAPANTVIWKVDPAANTKTHFFDTARLRKALASELGHAPPYHGLPFSQFSFLDKSEKAVSFAVENRRFILELDSYALRQASPPSEEERRRFVPQVTRKDPYGYWPDVLEALSPDRRWFAGIRENNLWLRSTEDGRTVQITTDGVQDDEWNEGYPRMQPLWSPDSRKLALNKLDFRNAPKIPVVHHTGQKPAVDWVYYPKAGERRAQSTLYIVDIDSKRLAKVDAAEEPGPRALLWRPDGSELLFLKGTRYGLKLELMAADPATGSTRVILSESDAKGVSFPFRQPHSMIWLLADGRRFIWMSARDGWDHLYLYDLDGKLLRRLTEGSFPVVRVVSVDEKTGWVYFLAQSDLRRPYDTHLCRVNLEGQGFQQLTAAPGQHEIRFSPSKEFFLDTHSSVNRPPLTDLRRVDGTLLQTVSNADMGALVNELKWKAPEEFLVKAADGQTDLYGVLYKPYDFDPNKRYAVFQFMAGNPYGIDLPRTFGDVRGQALAQLGFIVIGVAPRGTGGRGKQFRHVAYGQPGQHETADLVAALRQLATDRPYMDLARVGLFGGSYTGFMVLRALLLAPDVYRVGVAFAPITDMADHWRNELILGPPEENEKAYADASNPALAANLKGKLLLIHGTSDIDVPISHTMKMVEALIQAGKPYDLLILPEQPHVPYGISGTYMREAIRRYFQEHLKP